MLKQQQTEDYLDPFVNFLEGGVQEAVIYQKNLTQNYKSRAQKNKERVERLTKHVTDPELRKQRKVERKQAQKAKLHQVIDSMTQQEARVYLDTRKKQKADLKLKVREAMQHGQVIMLDLVYEEKMNQKEQKSLSKQIELIMRAIKHTKEPPSIHLCSLKGNLEKQLQRRSYKTWALTPHEEDVVQIAAKMEKKLIYLSPDAQLPLQSVDKDTCYILGGLIDRTIIKNASLNRAKQLGIEARKLPISEYMKGRLCLNLDHVVSMVCKFSETGSWKQAFDYAAPKRWKKQSGENEEKEVESEQQTKEKTQEAVKKKNTKLQQGVTFQEIQKLEG